MLVDLGAAPAAWPGTLTVVAQEEAPPPGKGAEFGKASPIGLVVILLLAVATVFLIRSMSKRIRRLPASFDPPEDPSPRADRRVAVRRSRPRPAMPTMPGAAGPDRVARMPNRLATATSPYLLQHADNPVDWWEWSDAAFAEAARRDVPVLLSVGYAACHWCHVMAHESFEDPATAEQLNAGFVAIKVDREERPDIDAVYMAATQAMTGQGGWPMTCFLTPAGEPFHCGTYYPATPRAGMPTFRQLLDAVSRAWREDGARVRGAAGEIAARLADSSAAALPPAGLDADALDRAARDPGATASTSGSAGSAGRPSSRRRWCWSSCCAGTSGPGRPGRCARSR